MSTWSQFPNSAQPQINYNLRSSSNIYHAHNKDKVNDGLAGFLRLMVIGGIVALVFDSSEMNTTRTLIDAGVQAKNIMIPNCDKAAYLTIAKHSKNNHPNNAVHGVHVVNNTLESVVELTAPYYVDFLFADFMATYHGSKNGCKPDQDIEKIFRRKILKNGAIFATTLCPRNTGGNGSIEKEILAVALKYGYVLTTIKIPGLNRSATYQQKGIDIQVFNKMYVFTFKVTSVNAQPHQSVTGAATQPQQPQPVSVSASAPVSNTCGRQTKLGRSCGNPTKNGFACHLHRQTPPAAVVYAVPCNTLCGSTNTGSGRPCRRSTKNGATCHSH